MDRAAENLVAAGTRPTVQRVHEIVGGSIRRVRPMLDEWWSRLADRLNDSAGDTQATVDSFEAADAFVRRTLDEARHAVRRKLRGNVTGASASTTKIALSDAANPATLRSAYRRAEQQIVELRAKERAFEDKLARIRNVLSVTERRATVLATTLQQLGSQPSESKPKLRRRNE